jgi:conjugal transfer ATP-binding protein TraC
MILEEINKVGVKLANYFGLTEVVEASSAQSSINGMKDGTSELDNYLSYRYFEEERKLFIGDGNVVGFLLEISPVVGVDEGLIKNLHYFLNDEFPDNSYLQFLLVASHDVDRALNLWQSARTNPLMDKITKKRAEFVRQRAVSFGESDGRIARDYRIFISFSQIATKTSADYSSITNFRQQLMHKLESLSLNYRQCESADLIELVRSMLQMQLQQQSYMPYDENNLLSKQMLLPCNAIEVTAQEINHLSTNLSSRCYHIAELPSEYWLGQNINLLGDPVSGMSISARFVISYTIASNISKGRKQAIIARGNKVIADSEKWYSRNDRNIKREAVHWQDVNDKARNGEKFFTTKWQMFITAPSEHLDKVGQELVSLYNLNNCQLAITKHLQLPSLLSMLPMQQPLMMNMMSKFKLTRLELTSEVVSRLPIYAEWKGVGRSGVLLHGRRGQLFNFNPFVKVNEGNYNLAMFAPSGGGKSVFLQVLAESLAAQGTRIFILDIGQSYANICGISQGEIIHFGKKNTLNLNPFSGFKKGMKPDDRDELLKCAKGLLEVMCGVGNDPMGSAELEKSIVSALEENEYEMDISKFASYLENNSSVNIKKYGATLYPYTENGLYGKYFAGKETASFKKLITVFEFEEIKNDPKLIAIILQILLMEVTNQFLTGDRKTPFMIIVDEAWMLLDFSAKFFAAFCRTVRKYNGSLVICVQNYTDFNASQDHKTILENSAWTIMLKQKDQGLASFKESENYKDKIPLIKSLSLVPGKYSEVLISSTGINVVGRLALDEYSSALYSTDGEDFSFIRSLTKQGISLDNAVEQLADRKNRKYSRKVG